MNDEASVCNHGRAGPQGFVPGICERLEPYLASQLVGQELALRQLADAVCDHTAGAQTPAQKPLVLSVHGPPGVGKSLAHLLLARALYNPDPAAASLRCPGPDCPGYKVLGSAPRMQPSALPRPAATLHAATWPH